MISLRDLDIEAKKVYNHKYLYPNSNLSNRCIDFKALENLAEKYKIKTDPPPTSQSETVDP